MGAGKVIEVNPTTKAIVWEYAGTGTDVVVTDQVPDGTKLVIGSVVFIEPVISGSYVMVSHDGGKTYDSSYTEPITHDRWTIQAMEPGITIAMEFKVVIQP